MFATQGAPLFYMTCTSGTSKWEKCLKRRFFIFYLNTVEKQFTLVCRMIGQCNEIFDFRFFIWLSFPQATEYPIRAVSNIFKNSRRNLQIFQIFLRILKNFEMILMLFSGAWGKMIHEKNLKQKSLWHCPFYPLWMHGRNAWEKTRMLFRDGEEMLEDRLGVLWP